MTAISNAASTEWTTPESTSAAAIAEQLAAGRAALAASSDPSLAASWRENRAITRLFALLWHRDGDIRRIAALALPGGDRMHAYQPQYGHFAAAFLRYIAQHSAERSPDGAANYQIVVAALRSMLQQSSSDIRAMSNMHYSFLSSALYLALLSTCRDVTESARRIRDGALHRELCRLLGVLAHSHVTRRLNAADAEALAASAGQALAAMPADEIPEFWHCLTHHARPRRRAVAPALRHIRDRKAVPYLIHALTGQPTDIAQSLIACLGQIGAPDALPALAHLARGRHRLLRNEAQSAIEAIRRATAVQPSQTLLRPAQEEPARNLFLLRTVDLNTQRNIEELVRPVPGIEMGVENDV
jgi:hypothetical protein